MLTNVPEGINRLARATVINHPNCWGGFVLRKALNRTAPSTLGGIGVLSAEDEEDFEFAFQGHVYALLADTFSPASMTERGDANIGAVNEMRFLIEPQGEPGQSDWFEIKKGDLFYIVLGIADDSPRIAYEIVGIETPHNVVPFSRRYVVNRRAEMDAGF